MKKKLLSFVGVFVFVLLFVSCELTNLPTTEDLQNAQGALTENSNAELAVINVFENVNNYGFHSDGLKSAFSDGPSYSWDSWTLTLDFSDVPGASGTISVAFAGTPGYTPGLAATLTFNEYSHQGTGLDGTMKLKVEDYVQNQVVNFSLKSQGNLTVTQNGESSYLWSCDQTIDWFEGIATMLDGSDDVFLLNGTGIQLMDSVTNKITLEDIEYATSCEYLRNGNLILVQDYSSDNELEIKCDFGVDASGNESGECDGYVEMSAGGITLSVNME